MTLYVDSSAITKLYIDEQWSQETTDRIRDEGLAASTLLARVEVAGAIARAARVGAMAAAAAAPALAAFERDWTGYLSLAVTEDIVVAAAGLAASHGLRAYDALHLASALAWAEAVNEPVTFATFDRALWRAAHDEGLDAWPENFAA